MSQDIANLTYNQVTTTSTSVSRQIEYQVAPDAVNPNKLVVVGSLNLSDTAVPQVSTITITAGSAGNEYAVTVGVTGSPSFTYRHKQVAGDTAASIAQFLATILDTNPNIVASVSGAVITVTGAVAGVAFTLDNSQSTTVGNVVTATTTAAAGTPKHRKIFDASLIFSVNANGFVTIESDGKFYDAALMPTVLQTFGRVSVANAPKALGTIILEQA